MDNSITNIGDNYEKETGKSIYSSPHERQNYFYTDDYVQWLEKSLKRVLKDYYELYNKSN